MKHYLLQYVGKDLLVFDDVRGELVGRAPSTESANGNYYKAGDSAVALYAVERELYMQIQTTKFLLSDATMTIDYEHDFNRRTTKVRVSDAQASVELEYEAWWSQLGLAPDDVMFAPERDAEEDQLAFLRDMLNNASWHHRMLEKWSKASM